MTNFLKTLNHAYLKIMVGITCYFVNNLAFADIISDSQSQSGDMAMQQLGKITGGVGSYVTGEALYNFSGMLEKYNSIIFGAGVIWLTYIMAKGLVDSSHDGEFLGKNTHSAWVPIRIAVATSMMAPVVGGFALAQIIMIGAAGTGVMAANAVWTAAKTSVGNATATSTTPYVSPVPLGGILESFKMGVCAKAFNNYLDAIASTERYQIQDSGLNYSTTRGTSGLGDYSCGSIEYGITSSDNYKKVDFSTVAKPGFDALNTAIWNYGGTIVPNVYKANESQTTPTDSIQLSDINSKASSHLTTINNAILEKTVSESNTARTELEKKLNAFDTAMGGSSDSWWFAGMHWVKESLQFSTSGYVSIEINTIRDPLGVQSGSIGEGGAGGILSKIKTSALNFSNFIASSVSDSAGDALQASNLTKTLVEKINTKFNIIDGEPNSKEAIDLQQSNFSPAAQSNKNIFELISDLSDPATYDPKEGSFDILSQLILIGQSLLNIALLGFAIGFGGQATSSIPYIGGAFAAIGSVLIATSAIIITPAIMLGFYMPMVPLINWITGLMSWLITVIEAVLAAPLWALVHLDTHGEGTVSQKSAHGYIFLFGTVLKPPLMVFGLVLGYALIKILLPIAIMMIAYIDISYAAGQGMTSFSLGQIFWHPFISIVVFGVFPTFMYFISISLINRSFSLIHLLPDQIISWVGGNFRGTGETDAGHIGQQTMGGLAAGKMAGNSISKTGQGVGKSAGAGAAWIKDKIKNRNNKDKKDNKDNNGNG
jgi:conjugal transfer/type IV secretion protein DotA/TraY